MASRAQQLGRHPWRAIAGTTDMPNDPRMYFNGAGQWSSPDSSINVLEFVAGAAVSLGQALFTLPDGRVAPADHLDLDQRGRYCGVALNSGSSGSKIYAQMYGLMTYHIPTLNVGVSVWIGQNGDLTQNYITDGYRQKVGKAITSSTILLDPGACIVTAAQSNALPWPGGANGGVDELEWATLSDLQAGVASRMAIAPDVLAAYMRGVIDEYGVTQDRIATITEVQQGTNKLVTGNVLRQYVAGSAGNVEFASTAEIEAGLVNNKAMAPNQFYPIYQALKNSGTTVEFADPAQTIAGSANDLAVTPFGLDSFRNDLLDRVQVMIDNSSGGGTTIPKATVQETLAGANVDKYVSPYVWRAALDTVLAGYTPGGGGSAGYYSTDIVGDGVETVFTITHDLNVSAPFVAIYDDAGNLFDEYAVALSGANAVVVTFTTAPTTTYKAAVAGGMSGGGGIAEIPWATDTDFANSTPGKVATIPQIKSVGGGGTVPQELYDRVTALETWKPTVPVLATANEVTNGTTEPLKVPSVIDIRSYIATYVSEHGGGGAAGEAATLAELIKGENNTKTVTPAGLHYIIGLRSMLRSDANGSYYITGMNDG